MESSESFSLDTSFQAKSFFSSFSSHASNTVWGPILNSIQENRRLSRVIQVRESKLQELKVKKPETTINLSTATNSNQSELLTEDSVIDLDSLIHQSMKNLKIHSVKLGPLPKSLSKALEITAIDPQTMNIKEKINLLRSIELLKEKLIDVTLDSDEIFSYFRDILLESEAGAVNSTFHKGKLMKIVDKRVEIFQSKDLIRTRIQEAYHLIMELEESKSRSSGLNTSFSNSWNQNSYETQIRELMNELNKKNCEIRRIKDFYSKKYQEIIFKTRTVMRDLDKLKHCVDYEMYYTWSTLLGDEGWDGVNCISLLKKLDGFRESICNNDRMVLNRSFGFRERTNQLKKKVDYLKQDFLSLRKSIECETREWMSFMSSESKRMINLVATYNNKTKQCEQIKSLQIQELISTTKNFKNEINALKIHTQEEMKRIFECLTSFVYQKLSHLKSCIKIARNSLNSLYGSFSLELGNFKSESSIICNTVNTISKRQEILLSKHKELKQDFTEEKIKILTSLNELKFFLKNKENVQMKLLNIINFLICELKKLKCLQKTEKENLKNYLNGEHKAIINNISPLTLTFSNLQHTCSELQESNSKLKYDLERNLEENSKLKEQLNYYKVFKSRQEIVNSSIVKTFKDIYLGLQDNFTAFHNESTASFKVLLSSLHQIYIEKENLSTNLKILEEEHIKIIGINSDLKIKLHKILQQKIAAKKTYTSRLSVNLRKIKAFRAVLQQEKETIKKYHKNLHEWISKSILSLEKSFGNGLNSLNNSLLEKINRIKQELANNTTRHIRLQKHSKTRLNSAAKHLLSSINQLKSFNIQTRKTLSIYLRDFFSGERSIIFSSVLARINAERAYKTTLKDKCYHICRTLKGFREQNNRLRDLVTKLLNTSTFEIETLKIKLVGQLKQDIDNVKHSLHHLLETYYREQADLESENSKLNKTVEICGDLLEPVESHLIRNKKSLENLSEVYEKTAKITQRNIEENIKKLDDVCCKIEGFKEKGYELLKKYKQEAIGFREISSEEVSINLSQDLSISSCEVSYISSVFEEDPRPNISNPLLSKQSTKVKSSLRLPYLVKTIEKLLGDKYKNDIDLLNRNKEPLTMPEYMLVWLNNDSRITADKKLSEILNGFQENIHDRRVRFYCRLFQIYDSIPLPYKLSVYLIKMRHYFNVFTNKQVIPESSVKKVNKLQVTEILKTVRKLFSSDIITGQVVLKHMKPENMISSLWTITCVQYYLYIKSLSPKECFTSLTEAEFLSESEFITGLSIKHETFVCEKELLELFNMNSTGLIGLDEFESLFDLKSYFERHQIYVVDQIQFLNALIEGYFDMRTRHVQEIERFFKEKCAKNKRIHREDAVKIILELDNSAKIEKIVDDSEEMLVKHLKRRVFQMNIAGKGIGCFNLKSIEKICEDSEIPELLF